MRKPFRRGADVSSVRPRDSAASAAHERTRRPLPIEDLLNADGSVSRAAEALGLSRQALYRRMEKLGIILERKPR
jgi:transcriptional regulator of acetoin/glycerol metabolism